MQAEDNKQSADDSETFQGYRDAKSTSIKGFKVTSKFKNGTRYTYVRRMRKQSHVKHRPRLVKVPFSDHPFSPEVRLLRPIPETVPISQIAFFKKREITTIQEEVLHYKHSKSHSAFKEKAYKEKVASLKNVVKRLQEMCLAKPDVLQNKPPEEIFKLFASIQI